MCTLDKSHARLMTFLKMRQINSKLDYDTLDIGTLDITASPRVFRPCCNSSITVTLNFIMLPTDILLITFGSSKNSVHSRESTVQKWWFLVQTVHCTYTSQFPQSVKALQYADTSSLLKSNEMWNLPLSGDSLGKSRSSSPNFTIS